MYWNNLRGDHQNITYPYQKSADKLGFQNTNS
uniref:Uncharacterized protein n=1 Tax=Rhizophora mucronata TaxID=61149 RepID=A0A2P2IHT4_RHIMU